VADPEVEDVISAMPSSVTSSDVVKYFVTVIPSLVFCLNVVKYFVISSITSVVIEAFVIVLVCTVVDMSLLVKSIKVNKKLLSFAYK
jgi:hypothetical protein